MTDNVDREQRRLHLRAAVKLLSGIGLVFLLIPFLKSLPLPEASLPANATTVDTASFRPGETRRVTLADGSAVFVTRSGGSLGQRLAATPAEQLWFPSPPGLATQPWLVLRPLSATDESIRFRAAAGAWPGGFVADSGAAWDLAGRALKPGPWHPGDSVRKEQNLLAMPWQLRGDDLVLVPAAP